MQKLFTTEFGSKLYGTATPTSDTDLKHIVLPDLNDLLVCKKIQNKVKKTNNVAYTKNCADDIDEEFIPLQVFAKDFVNGQTYALEIAFAVDGCEAGQTLWCYSPDSDPSQLPQVTFPYDPITHNFVIFARELREKFLTSNIKAMMGYVVNQASLYSFKGERLNATRELKAYLSDSLNHLDERDDMEEFAVGYKEELDALCAVYPKYVRRDQYDIGGGRMKPCLVILEKTLPYSNTIAHSLTVLNALESKYGARADAATENNVDWKATMHALRIVDEGIQLLEHHTLSFPFSENYANYLLSIKRGELPLDPIKEELSAKLEKLKELETTTNLPAMTDVYEEFEKWLAVQMRKFYRI